MCGESTTGGGKGARLGAADYLSLAAAPIFALMAVLVGAFGGASAMHSAGMHSPGALDGMALMYVLMAVFHSAPWLQLLAVRRAKVTTERRLAHLGRASGSTGPVACCNVLLHSLRRGQSPSEPTT